MNCDKQRLEIAKITFTQADITELPTKFKAYDFVELSNILTYGKEIFGNYIKYHASKLISAIYEKNLKNNGTMIY